MWIKDNKNGGDEVIKNPDSFFERTYAIVRRIPEGRVTTYIAIAKYLNPSGNSSKDVALALEEIENGDTSIPAHRVIHRDGAIMGNYFSGSIDQKKTLLENEGVEFENDKVLNFNKVFWDPSKRLKS